MKAKHYAILAASALLPLLTSFLSNWDRHVTSSSIVAALVATLAVFTKSPSQGGAS